MWYQEANKILYHQVDQAEKKIQKEITNLVQKGESTIKKCHLLRLVQGVQEFRSELFDLGFNFQIDKTWSIIYNILLNYKYFEDPSIKDDLIEGLEEDVKVAEFNEEESTMKVTLRQTDIYYTLKYLKKQFYSNPKKTIERLSEIIYECRDDKYLMNLSRSLGKKIINSELDQDYKIVKQHIKEQLEYLKTEMTQPKVSSIKEQDKIVISEFQLKMIGKDAFEDMNTDYEDMSLKKLHPTVDSKQNEIVVNHVNKILKQIESDFQSNDDFLNFKNILINYFSKLDYNIKGVSFNLVRGSKSRVAPIFNELHKKVHFVNTLKSDTRYFDIIRVLNHYSETINDTLYKQITRKQ